MRKNIWKAFLIVTAAGWVAALPAQAYRLVKKIPLSGDGFWDLLAVDSTARRLYIAHNDQVQILNVDTDQLVGQIPDLKGVHGIALAPEFRRGFITNGRGGTVTIFDLKDQSILGEVRTGENPDAVLYDPVTRRVFAFNGRTQNATVFRAASGDVEGTVALGGKPEFAAVDGAGAVYVNLEDKNEILRIDSRSLTVEKRWPVAPCEEPASLAMDVTNTRLFVGCGNKKMAVLDAKTGQVLTTLPIGDHVDATVFDPQHKLLFNANGEGTITVIHEDSPDQFSVVETVQTQKGARTAALDEATGRLFLATALFGPPVAPTPDQPRPRPAILPGTFMILVVAPD